VGVSKRERSDWRRGEGMRVGRVGRIERGVKGGKKEGDGKRRERRLD